MQTQVLLLPGSSVTVPGGSSQTFQSVMGRAQFELGPRVNGTLSDNFGSYTDVYSQNGGLTFQSATHTYQAPRLSLTWRPNANQSVRASIGTSIAPPYIALLNNNAIIGLRRGIPPPYYTETETAATCCRKRRSDSTLVSIRVYIHRSPCFRLMHIRRSCTINSSKRRRSRERTRVPTAAMPYSLMVIRHHCT